MIDTCVMCGIPVPEGTQVCLHCQRRSSDNKVCPDCACQLQTMHTSYAYTNKGLVRSTLFHCRACSSDWELEVPLIEQPGEFKRKFWG